MSVKTPAQQRAEHALERIDAVGAAGQATRKAYLAYVKSLPAMIIMAGLGQAVATCMARAGEGEGNQEAYRHLVEHLEDWLCRRYRSSPYHKASDPGHPAGRLLLEQITTNDQDAYVIAQAEALAYLDWLKKLANGLLVGGEPDPQERRAP